MVGAGVRSKGCRTCRRRRVRCDERHPFCLRCEDGSFVCEGFGHDLKFVDENSRTACQVRKKKSVPISIPARKNNHEINKLAFSKRWSNLGISEYQPPAVSTPPRSTENGLEKNEDLALRILMSTTRTRLVTSLDLSGFRDNIQISFTLSTLLRGFPMTVLWMLEGVSNDSEMSTPTQALLALSSVFFGRIHKQQQCIDNGSMQYCKALRNLNTDLNSSRATDLDVLTGVMSLWLYEMLASRSSEGALKHAGGIGALIRLRGPERHQSPFELHLLESIRISVIHDGLITRKRIFLEQEAWKTIPWSQSATPKSMNSQLQDILCDIPGLMEDYDKVRSMNLTTPEATLYYEALYSSINQHLTMLYAWRLRWELLYPDGSQEAKNSEDSPTGSGAIFPTVFNFTSLEVANGIMIYDASLLLLINIGMDLTNNNFDHRSPAPQLSYQHENTALYLPGQASRYEIALEICRSVDYYLLPEHAFAGAFCVLLPLRVAFGAMVPGSDEAEWILATLFRVGEFSGFEISKGLVS